MIHYDLTNDHIMQAFFCGLAMLVLDIILFFLISGWSVLFGKLFVIHIHRHVPLCSSFIPLLEVIAKKCGLLISISLTLDSYLY
jgi:hypothetical protein